MGATNIVVNKTETETINAQNCKTWSNQTYPITPQLLMI